MRVLVAEDHEDSRRLLEATLRLWGHEPVPFDDGAEALRAIESDTPPPIGLIDWMMPGLDGATLCRRVRAGQRNPGMYLILLTAKTSRQDVIAGLDAGADDYVMKPFDPDELHARLDVGIRVATLQTSLADRVAELEQALTAVKQLQGLLPICSYCKKIRDDSNYWQQVESYISSHANVQFSHGICPECERVHLEPELERFRRTGQ